MCVQFVRFFWKQASVTQDTEGTKAKILRSVAFDRRLDVYEFCSDSLKKSLDQGRIFEEKMIEEQDKQVFSMMDKACKRALTLINELLEIVFVQGMK